MHMCVCMEQGRQREGGGSDTERAKHREEQACYGVFSLLVEIDCCVYFFEPAG